MMNSKTIAAIVTQRGGQDWSRVTPGALLWSDGSPYTVVMVRTTNIQSHDVRPGSLGYRGYGQAGGNWMGVEVRAATDAEVEAAETGDTDLSTHDEFALVLPGEHE